MSAPAGPVFSVVGVASPAPKVFTTAWKEEWTGCFDDGESCVLSTFCPCVQFAKNYVVGSTPGYGAPPEQLVSQNMGLACGACVVYAGGLYFCANIGIGIMGCVSRGQIRNKYSITTGDCADSCSDCLLHSFCTCCALSQEWRELKFRADQPTTITVPGGAIVGTAVQGPAVVVMTSPVYAQPMANGQQSPPAYVQQPPQQQQQQQYAQPQPQYAAQPQYAGQPQQAPPQQYAGQPQYAAQPVQFAPQGQPQYTAQPQYAAQPQQQMQR